MYVSILMWAYKCQQFSFYILSFLWVTGRVTAEMCISFSTTILLYALTDMSWISNLLPDTECYTLILVHTRNGKCGTVLE